MSGVDRFRNQEIAKIKIGQKKLAIDDETYRDLLERLTGKRSATELDTRQRHKVLTHLEQQGAYADQAQVKRSRDPQARMIHALWTQLGERGALRDPTKHALRIFLANMFHPGNDGITLDPDHLDIEQGRQVIEALKAWLKRVGG